MASLQDSVELDISLLELNKHNGLVPISALQNQKASETGWPESLAGGTRLLLCLVC